MNQGPDEDDGVLVLLPLPADPLFVDAVDEAIAGDVAEMPAVQPDRPVGGKSTDFASLYIRHRASFALHARRFLNDPRDVDEVLQEAFLRLFLAMPELENELQALTYCRRTVTNLCIDRYRADQRRPRLVDLELVEWDPSDVDSYDDPVLRAEDAAIVREALALLSPLHREALIKREIEEKPLPQIAAELGIPEENVKHLLYRARRSLRKLLVGTSVEPGVDLSATQALRLANERLARATLRSANVLIVLFVATVAVVGALRVGFQDHLRSGEVSSEAGPVLGGLSNPGHSPRFAISARPHKPQLGAPRNASPPAPAVPTVASTPSTTATPVRRPHRDTFSSVPVAPRQHSAYTLRGSLRPTGPVLVQSLPSVIDPANGVIATSVLSAPTTMGVFTLTQTIAQAGDGTTSVVNVTPAFAIGSTVISVPVVDSGASVSLQPDGTQAVQVTLHTSPNLSTNLFPLTSVHADVVTSGDFRQVLSESVTVNGLSVRSLVPPSAGASDPVVTSTTALPATPPVDPTASCPATISAAEPAPGFMPALTADPVTPSYVGATPGVTPVTGLSGESVIEVHPIVDDQESTCSS